MKVKVLGSYGYPEDLSGTTCFQLSERVIIDAGRIFRFIETDPNRIEYVLMTHAHFDHLSELPFLIDATFGFRKRTLKVCGSRKTVDILKENIFNDLLWPDFSSINLPGSCTPSMECVVLEEGKVFRIDGFEVVPFRANHVVETFGYLVKDGSTGVVFSGDTSANGKLWDIVNGDETISAVFVDVSFPSYCGERAALSGHMTPKTLKEELSLLKRRVDIYIFHAKPFYFPDIEREMSCLLPEVKVLKGGEEIVVGGGVV